jgi:hypothetical protein
VYVRRCVGDLSTDPPSRSWPLKPKLERASSSPKSDYPEDIIGERIEVNCGRLLQKIFFYVSCNYRCCGQKIKCGIRGMLSLLIQKPLYVL